MSNHNDPKKWKPKKLEKNCIINHTKKNRHYKNNMVYYFYTIVLYRLKNLKLFKNTLKHDYCHWKHFSTVNVGTLIVELIHRYLDNLVLTISSG